MQDLLLSAGDTPDLEAQIKVESLPMSRVYSERLASERQRVESIERFDEYEEWDLLQSHYCLTLATRFASDQSPLNNQQW